MRHYILNKRADEHYTHCEDSYFYTEIDGWVIAAVFDGCSDSLRPHFASQLYSYALRKVVTEHWTNFMQIYSREEMDMSMLVNSAAALVGAQASVLVEQIGLTELESLSTVVLALYHIQEKELIVKFLGDGAVQVDGEMFRETSGPENTPKYPAYLDDDEMQPTMLQDIYPERYFTMVNHFSICTDGIDAMRHPTKSLEECIEYLLQNNNLAASESMLRRKMNLLKKEDMRLLDDLTIIRYEAV